MATFKAPLQSLPQLATTVRDARVAAHLSQTELALKTGIPRPWISQLETGKLNDPGLTRVLAICDALGISLTSEYAVAGNDNDAHSSKTQKTSDVAVTSDTSHAVQSSIDIMPKVPGEAMAKTASELANILRQVKIPGVASLFAAMDARAGETERQAKELEGTA